MKKSKLEQEGERLYQQFLADLEKATPEQRAEANRITEQHLYEYSHSLAENLHKILNP